MPCLHACRQWYCAKRLLWEWSQAYRWPCNPGLTFASENESSDRGMCFCRLCGDASLKAALRTGGFCTQEELQVHLKVQRERAILEGSGFEGR